VSSVDTIDTLSGNYSEIPTVLTLSVPKKQIMNVPTITTRGISPDGPNGLGRGSATGATATNHLSGRDLGGPVAGRDRTNPNKPSAIRSLVECIIVIGGAALVAILVRMFVMQVFFIPSKSMEPTLMVKDKVVVDKFTLRFTDVKRGDLVVFTRPVGLADTGIKDLVKRVVGLEGDTVEAIEGAVYVNGQPINEPYLATPLSTSTLPKTTVGAGQLFVMGDNRGNSSDSRVFGTISADSVVGKARAVVWPIGNADWFSNPN
jgi:signal peptidase I